MPSACLATTYAIPARRRRGGRVVALLACVLGLLQACRSGDAVSPIPSAVETPVTPAAPAAPRNIQVGTDTVQPGQPLAVTGEGLPVSPASVSATLGGIPLPVRVVSVSALQFDVPNVFPCAPAAVARLVLRLGAVSVERDVVVRTATRVSLDAGATRSLHDAGPGVCVELAATTGDAANARFVLAVVNTKPFVAESPSWSMRGVGAGAAAGMVSVEQAPGTTAAGLQAAASMLTVTATRPALASVESTLDRHEAIIDQHAALASRAGMARERWQARGTGLPMARLARATVEGDTVRFTAMSGSCHRGQPVAARAVYAGANVVVFEDLASATAGRMNDVYRQIGEEYDAVMHPLLVSQVGNPLAMQSVMNTGASRVALLFTRFVNDSLSGTAAFVSACNFYPKATFAASNEAPVVYGRVPGHGESATEWRRSMRATVMHEAKHLASFAERMAAGRDFDEPWLEEATARVAEELYARTFTQGAGWRGNVGFAASVQCEVLQCDDRPLVMWKHFTGLHAWLRTASSARVGQLVGEAGTALNATAANAAYASGWALVRWVLDHHVGNERDAVRALVAGNGRTGLSALASLAGMSESALVTAWAASLAAETGPRSSPSAVSPSTWASADIIGGMASMFPGVFAAQPLAVSRRSLGTFATSQAALTGTAHYVELSGNLVGAGQVVQLTAGPAGGVGLSVYRAR